MLNEGEFVRAKVVRVVQYGVYFESAGSRILVLAPDAADGPEPPLEVLYKIGAEFNVRAGHYVSSDSCYRGYLK